MRRITQVFLVKLSARVFIYVKWIHVWWQFWRVWYFPIVFFLNLVDRDFTEYQITQTLTLSRLHAQLEQARWIRLFTHTQHVDWSRQGESDWIITFWSKQENHPFQRSENPCFWRTCVYNTQVWWVVSARRCWQRLAELENRSIHSKCTSCRVNLDAGKCRVNLDVGIRRMNLDAGIRRMNLDAGIRRMLIFPSHWLWKRSQRREIPWSSATVTWTFTLRNSKCFRHELVWNRPVDPDLCSQCDVLVRAQFDAHARLFSVVLSLTFMSTDNPHWPKCHLKSQSFCTGVFIMMSLCWNSVGRRSCHRACKTFAWLRSCDMTTANIAEVLKLAAKLVQYDNDEKSCLS